MCPKQHKCELRATKYVTFALKSDNFNREEIRAAFKLIKCVLAPIVPIRERGIITRG